MRIVSVSARCAFWKGKLTLFLTLTVLEVVHILTLSQPTEFYQRAVELELT